MSKAIFRILSISLLCLVACGVMACSSGKNETLSATESAMMDPWVEVEQMVYDGHFREAIEKSTELLNTQGKSVRGLTLRGIAYAKFGKQLDSYYDLIEASEMDRNVDTLMNIGNALRMYGHCDRALDAYKQALVMSPNNPEILINLTSAYLCLGDVELANQTIQQTFGNFPNDAIAYTNVAILKHMAGDFEEAKQAAQKAIQLDGSYVPAYQVLYRACLSLNDKACADDAKYQHNSKKGKKYRVGRKVVVPPQQDGK